MPQLSVLSGPNSGQVYSIHNLITIGDQPSCNILLANDNTVPICIEIRRVGKQYCLCKKQGQIPLLVNGKEVKTIPLVYGDIITVADTMLFFNGSNLENILLHTGKIPANLLGLASPKEQKKNQQLVDSYHISTLVSSTLDLRELLDRLADFFLEAFQATNLLIFLLEDEQPKPVVCKSVCNRIDQKLLKVSLDKKNVFLVTQKNKAILFQSQYARKFSYFMAAPLAYQNQVLGMVVLEARQNLQSNRVTKIFSVQDLYMLGRMSLMAANGIANLQRYLKRKSHTRDLETLSKITLKLSSRLNKQRIYQDAVRGICKLLKCTKSSVLTLNNDNCLRIGYAIGMSKEEARQVEVPYGKGLAGWVVQNGKPLSSSDLPDFLALSGREKYFSDCFMIAPVFGRWGKKTDILGVICVADRINHRHFSKHHKTLLTFIASQMGIALVNASLYQQATVDFLTKVYVRRYFFENLSKTMQQCRENNTPLSLLMLDIDFFKSFNDTYGHQIGDKILRGLGKLIKQCIREGDAAGRYGGEEFVVLLRDTNYSSALTIAERIRSTIENFVFKVANKNLGITVSIGVAEYLFSESPDDLLLRCDRAMYTAKNKGRNCVC